MPAKAKSLTRSFTFRIDAAVYATLEKMAEKDGLSIGSLLNQAAKKYAQHGSKPVKEKVAPEPVQPAETPAPETVDDF